ncbi:putative clathrin assembly protein [Camellia lanceoleosa]|uniref:Clathrin assembly protein n=1 Tax=Camellia lanceoleosa TaxID=1840588 RepID=A0ACC0GD05_9ERIC|nr:putative clathrin assembly protein [Camellia lanceoleosa]
MVFFPPSSPQKESNDKCTIDRFCNYSWCGQRKMPSYVKKLVFPEDFLTTLRTIAKQEDKIYQVSSLLQELVSSDGVKQPSDGEVRAITWEACGDFGALQLLVDLPNMKKNMSKLTWVAACQAFLCGLLGEQQEVEEAEDKETLVDTQQETEPEPMDEEVPPLISTDQTEDLLGLNEINPKVAEVKESNALAFAIVPSG